MSEWVSECVCVCVCVCVCACVLGHSCLIVFSSISWGSIMYIIQFLCPDFHLWCVSIQRRSRTYWGVTFCMSSDIRNGRHAWMHFSPLNLLQWSPFLILLRSQWATVIAISLNCPFSSTSSKGFWLYKSLVIVLFFCPFSLDLISAGSPWIIISA